MSIGFTIGKFAPFHKGHEYLIDTAIKENDEFYILINDTDVIDVPIEERAKWIQDKYPKAHIILGRNPPKRYGMDEESIKIQTDYLKDVFKGIPVDTFYSSEDYGTFVAKAFNIKNVKLNKEVPISATQIRKDIEQNKQYLESNVYNDCKNRLNDLK